MMPRPRRSIINEEGTKLALLWNVAGKNELAFYDIKAGKAAPGPRLPGEIVGEGDFSKDGSRLALVASGSAAPRDIHVLDLKSQRFTQISRSPHAGVDLATMVRPELLRYKADDGLELSGWLYRPKEMAGPAPVVLSFHGGPEGQERPNFSSTYQALVARGIAVFAPNVRGSAGFGKRFVNLDNGALRENGVRDIKATVDYVVGAKIADPRRIGIMGGSYGGYMVMAGLTEYPDLFAAGANLFGIVNFETFFKNTQPWMAAISKVEYGNPETEAEMLKKLSPIHRLERVRTPTIVLHGANDTNVPVIEAEQVVENLKRQKYSRRVRALSRRRPRLAQNAEPHPLDGAHRELVREVPKGIARSCSFGPAWQKPIEGAVKIRDAGAFERIVMAGAGERDDALFAGISIDDQALEFRRNDFIIFREQENRGDANGLARWRCCPDRREFFARAARRSSHKFHQPNWRRMICRKAGGLCRIRPATCRCAATWSAVVVPRLAPKTMIGRSPAVCLSASKAASAAGPSRASRAGPVLPPKPG